MAWKLAPALAAGCTMVSRQCRVTTPPPPAVQLAGLLAEAGVPAGSVQRGDRVRAKQWARRWRAHPDVDKIAFTGSTTVGAKVAEAAAANITGVVLELGGKSAHVVFGDADLEAVSNGVVAGVFARQRADLHRRLAAAGAPPSVHDELVARIVARAEAIEIGDPRDEATEMGPLATRAAVRQGPVVLRGRHRRGRDGRHRRVRGAGWAGSSCARPCW